MKIPKPKVNMKTKRAYRLEKMRIKQQMGSNKGKTARAISRHTATSSVAQAASNTTRSNTINADINYKTNVQKAQDQVDTDTKKNNTSSDITGWLN